MAAVGNRDRQVSQVQPDSTAGGWIPARVTNFGRRFADARGFSGRLDAELEAADVSLRSGEFVIVTVGAAFVGLFVGYAIFGSPWILARRGGPRGTWPPMALKLALGRRAEKLREQLPDVLTIMASSLRAGHSFLQALDTTAKEIAQPAATEFQRVVAEIRLGRSAEDALGALAERVGSRRLQVGRPRREHPARGRREPGGDPGQRRGHAPRTRDDASPDPGVDVGGPALGLGAGVMPFVIALYMYAVNKEYIMLLFTTKIGLMMLVGAASRSTSGSSGCGRS